MSTKLPILAATPAARIAEYVRRFGEEHRDVNNQPDILQEADEHQRRREAKVKDRDRATRYPVGEDVLAPRRSESQPRDGGGERHHITRAATVIPHASDAPGYTDQPKMRPQSLTRASSVYPVHITGVYDLTDFLRSFNGDDVNDVWLEAKYGKNVEADLWEVPVAQCVPGKSHRTIHFTPHDHGGPVKEPMPPLLVSLDGGKYIVVDGNRRLKRARQAGLTTLPAYVIRS